MRMNAMRMFILAGLAGVWVFGSAAQSHASWTLTLEDVGTGVTENFSGVSPGGAVFSTPKAGFNFTVAVGIGDATSTVGTTSTFTLAFNSFDVNNLTASADTLKAFLTDSAVGPPFAPLTVSSSLSDTLLTGTGSSISFQTFVGTTNSTLVTLTGAPAATASPTYTVPTITSPYSVENITTIHLGASGLANETGTSVVAGPASPRFVSEPPTLTLAAFGLASCGVLLLRRRKTLA